MWWTSNIQILYDTCMNTKTINLSMPIVLMEEVSMRAKDEARTISGLIQEAVRAYLARRQGWGTVFQYGKKMGIKSKIDESAIENVVDSYRNG